MEGGAITPNGDVNNFDGTDFFQDLLSTISAAVISDNDFGLTGKVLLGMFPSVFYDKGNGIPFIKTGNDDGQ